MQRMIHLAESSIHSDVFCVSRLALSCDVRLTYAVMTYMYNRPYVLLCSAG